MNGLPVLEYISKMLIIIFPFSVRGLNRNKVSINGRKVKSNDFYEENGFLSINSFE